MIEREIISSKENPFIKNIRSLESKKNRDEKGLFILEGPKVLLEALREKYEILAVGIREDLFNSEDALHKELLENLFTQSNEVRVVCIKKEIFNGLTATENSQGVLGILKMRSGEQKESELATIRSRSYCLLALDEIKDPGNMGTIIRTAEAFGIDGILVGKGSVDIYNEKVVRSTMGSLLRMKIWTVDSLEKILGELRGDGAEILGADPHTENDFRTMPKSPKTVLVIGNEARGISEEVRNVLTKLITIPMAGRAESLNAAIATALIAYEFTNKGTPQ